MLVRLRTPALIFHIIDLEVLEHDEGYLPSNEHLLMNDLILLVFHSNHFLEVAMHDFHESCGYLGVKCFEIHMMTITLVD